MIEDDNFLKTKLTFGLVVRTDLQSIEAIKSYIADLNDVKVIYQRISTNQLYIKEKDINEKGNFFL